LANVIALSAISAVATLASGNPPADNPVIVPEPLITIAISYLLI
jgi:hypothetical protein